MWRNSDGASSNQKFGSAKNLPHRLFDFKQLLSIACTSESWCNIVIQESDCDLVVC